MSDIDQLKDRVERLAWDMEQMTQLRGACSCGDSTILGVVHSDTSPCKLPTVHRPLTDDEVYKVLDNWSDLGRDLLEVAYRIENAHGIGGIREV